jgi:hypothetical protein
MAAANPGQEGPRTSMVSVRLAPEEQEALKTEAAESGETLSQFIRSTLLKRTHSAPSAADLRLYPVSTTVVSGGLAIEAREGQLVPITNRPYVTLLPE